MVDGFKSHNSLGTVSFAAWRLGVSEFFKPFTTREIPSLTTSSPELINRPRRQSVSLSHTVAPEKKGTHAKPQRRKEETCDGGIAGD
jgi:hypothetical protein